MYEHDNFDPRPGGTHEQRRAHYAELMNRRIAEGIPFMWTGLHSSLCGAQDAVHLPARGRNHDWELEVAIVIGRTARHVPPERALELVAGYTIVNDLGTTDTFRRTDPIPFPHDWIGKSSPTFKPAGPFIVPRELAGPVPSMRIRLSVNDRLMQNARADDMIFGVERLVWLRVLAGAPHARRPHPDRLAARQRCGQWQVPRARRRDCRGNQRPRPAAQPLRQRGAVRAGAELNAARVSRPGSVFLMRAFAKNHFTGGPRAVSFHGHPQGTARWRLMRAGF